MYLSQNLQAFNWVPQCRFCYPRKVVAYKRVCKVLVPKEMDSKWILTVNTLYGGLSFLPKYPLSPPPPPQQVEMLSSSSSFDMSTFPLLSSRPTCDHGLHPQPHLGPAPMVRRQQDRGRQRTVRSVLRVA